MLSKTAVLELVEDLLPRWQTEKDRLDWIELWAKWTHEDIKLPREANAEHRALADLAKTPWLGLVVASVSQCLYVDGWRNPNLPGDPDLSSGVWKTWLANGFDRRQIQVHRAALTFGYSFVRVLPGDDELGPRSVMRGMSPRKVFAVYSDAADDDWPVFVIEVDSAPGGKKLVKLYDEEHIYFVEAGSSTEKPKYIEDRVHGAQVTPFVRYGMPDLEGNCVGQVEPFISVAARANKTIYDRLLTQHFNSWKVRTIAGMDEPKTEEEKRQALLTLRQNMLLISDNAETKFGTLPETPLQGFIEAHDSDINDLSAVSQTPAHDFGKMINLSAEAIAAARSGLIRKAFEWRQSFGASHAQTNRLGAALEGNTAEALDIEGRVTWQDLEARSLSQAVDALGKAAQTLNVPLEALWPRIPGVDKTDVDEWKALAAEAAERDPMTQMTRELERQGNEVR